MSAAPPSPVGPPRSGRATVAGALVLVQLFFGLHYLAAKLVLEAIPPRAWAAIRVTSAAAVLLAVAAALRRLPRFAPADLARLALYSLFGVTINQICFVEGLYRTTPTHSALINTTIPVGTLIFAVLMGRERLDARKLWAVGLSLAGVFLIIVPRGAVVFSVDTRTGDLLTLVNALSYSFFLVLSKRLLSRSDPLAATTVLLAFGAAGVLLVGGRSLSRVDFASVRPSVWALAAFIVLFATVAAYFLNYWALVRVDPSIVALFIYLQPAVAAGLSAVFLGERPGGSVLAGGALVFAGVGISQWRSRPPAQSDARAIRASSSAPRGSTDSSMSNRGE